MPFSTLGFSTTPTALFASLVAGSVVGAGAYRTLLRKPFSARGASLEPGVDDDGATSNLTAAPRRAAARPNMGRLLLPALVAQLTEDDEPALGAVDPFIDRLAELRVSEWVAIGRTVVEDRGAVADRSTSWAIVDATIAHRRLGIAAWHVRDAIETASFLTRRSAPALSRSDRRLFFAAQAAAEDAALALLVHACIPEQDLVTLCAPFAPRTPHWNPQSGSEPRQNLLP